MDSKPTRQASNQKSHGRWYQLQQKGQEDRDRFCEPMAFMRWSWMYSRAYKQDYWCLQTAEVILLYRHCDTGIILSFLIYSAGRYLIRELCQPWHSVHHSLPPVRKCSNVTDLYELSDFILPNSPGQKFIHSFIHSSFIHSFIHSFCSEWQVQIRQCMCNALWVGQQGSKTNTNSCPLD